jgi:major vault protein
LSELNLFRIAIGPVNFIKQENELIVKPVADMIKLPPNHYCIVKNPIVRDPDTGSIVSATQA